MTINVNAWAQSNADDSHGVPNDSNRVYQTKLLINHPSKQWFSRSQGSGPARSDFPKGAQCWRGEKTPTMLNGLGIDWQQSCAANQNLPDEYNRRILPNQLKAISAVHFHIG
jgi:hypothetical protein